MMLGYCQQCCFKRSRIFASFVIRTLLSQKAWPEVLGIRHSSSTSTPRSAAAKSSNCFPDRVVFLGSDSFSVSSLEILLKLYLHENITVVVSNEKNTVGKFSIKNQLKIIPWEEFKTLMRSGGEVSSGEPKFDLGVVSSFGFLIPKYIIECCRMGILNVHASLLPRWRGAAPIAHAIINGDEETGITIMNIAPHKFDVGPILHTKRIAIAEHVKAPELTNVLAELGGQALEEVLRDLLSYTANARVQSLEEGTLAPRLTSDIGRIRWDSQTPTNIYNLFRGIYGFHKLRSNYDGKQVDFDELCLASMISEAGENQATVNVESFPKTCDNFLEGQILYWNKLLCVKCFSPDKSDKCIRNNWIFIRKIKIGKKWISALDFSNGFLSKSHGSHYFISNSSDMKEINTKC